jgi:hypothetical protein
MKKVSIAVLFLLVCSSGCELACTTFGVTCDDNIHKLWVSEDPQACKSIKVDCSNFGDNGYFDRADGVRYEPFSDSTGCGCVAYTWERGCILFFMSTRSGS